MQLRLAVHAALALLILSLGFPWVVRGGSGGVPGSLIPGYFVPGLCRTTFDADGWASMECDPSIVGVPIYSPGVASTRGSLISGRRHPGRFGVAIGFGSTILGLRRRNNNLLAAAGVIVAGQAIVSAGMARLTAGVTLALIASLILVAASQLTRSNAMSADELALRENVRGAPRPSSEPRKAGSPSP
jgi:hypothetical protein